LIFLLDFWCVKIYDGMEGPVMTTSKKNSPQPVTAARSASSLWRRRARFAFRLQADPQ
jgi:hypothetical protein